MSIQKCLLDNSSRMIKAMSTAKSNNNEVKTDRLKHSRIYILCRHRKSDRLRPRNNTSPTDEGPPAPSRHRLVSSPSGY
ncbi:hypothetical protein RR48_13172 [Papilio machaon]|uniref:Uncharacterized protein n=1 Tax=Papilio machaon TaxID=76193 RepID=A0A194QVH4_PAPMA|nr:hypothetical protein RR48_13172 [Papilio machaon]